MKKWYWIILAVVAYIVFLIAYIPAIYVSDFISNKTNNRAVFSNVSGTLFNGQATSLTVDGNRINNINWELSPLYLLLLQAKLDINGGTIRNAEEIHINGNVRIPLLNAQKVSLNDANILVPAKNLFSQLTLPVAVTASGRFRVDIDKLTYENGCTELSGTGNWLRAAVSVNNKPVDFNSFSAKLSCEMPAIVMQIEPDNAIALDAKVSISPDGKYRALGSFSIPNEFPEEIKQGASFFGERGANGVYNLNI